jgi:succinate dehydrogenase / fumarate reductase membrane anchor subunit
MRQTGSYGWLFQRLSGVILFVLLLVHFVLMHYLGGEKKMYADVVRRLSNPHWKTFDLVFLGLGLYHGWYGVWGIVGDYVRNGAVRILSLVLIVTAALVLFSLGLVTILAFHGG